MNANEQKNPNDIVMGATQWCPLCGMHNTSGWELPEQCYWCKGTGKVDFGLNKLANKAFNFDAKKHGTR